MLLILQNALSAEGSCFLHMHHLECTRGSSLKNQIYIVQTRGNLCVCFYLKLASWQNSSPHHDLLAPESAEYGRESGAAKAIIESSLYICIIIIFHYNNLVTMKVFQLLLNTGTGSTGTAYKQKHFIRKYLFLFHPSLKRHPKSIYTCILLLARDSFALL